MSLVAATADAAVRVGASIADINRTLRPTRWQILDACVNTTTGFARIIAERRESDHGVQVTLLRSCHAGRVVEMREVTAYRVGFYTSGWEVTGVTLGQRRHRSFDGAMRALATYIGDNCGDALSPADVGAALLPLHT